MFENIYAMYFSPTGTSEKVVNAVARVISNLSKKDYKQIDFAIYENREKKYVFTQKDLLIIGLPTYAGRLPNILLDFLKSLEGKNTLAVPFVLYGNRNFDDALIELKKILQTNGFINIAAGAFVGEHSFSYELAKGRPNLKDLQEAEEFASDIYEKIKNVKTDTCLPINLTDEKYGVIDDGRDVRPYYKPRDRQGIYINILKVKPKVNDLCTDCKACVSLCPMKAIDYDDVSKYNNICIKCGACIKKCPQNARYIDDEGYIYHKEELEFLYKKEKENRKYI